MPNNGEAKNSVKGETNYTCNFKINKDQIANKYSAGPNCPVTVNKVNSVKLYTILLSKKCKYSAGPKSKCNCDIKLG